MKKIFIAVSSFFMVAVITMLIVLGNVRKNIVFEYDRPSVIRVYNKSTNPIKNEGYTKNDEPFGLIVEKLKEMTNMTLMQRLNNLKTLKANVNVDSAGTYNSWQSEMKKDNIVIEMDFPEEQDLVVYDGGNTRVISYWCLAYVITTYENFDEIVIYYSTTNSSTAREESYAKCDPIVIKGYTEDIVRYVNTI
ncbi:MAG: hypothetical protein IJA23_02270 [Clostridia bacterium]|nr:hypothetical protein [Clostridia bacterium]